MQATLATGLLGATRARAAESARETFRDDPFTLGIASGYPTASGVVLWTRLAPKPLAPLGGLTAPHVPVDWVLATDEKFTRVVRSGTVYATPDWAYSVHVELTRLEPARLYWYRFTAGGVRSPVGRTRTAPAAGAPQDRLRFAVASCQQYEHGYYGAYRHMLADDPDWFRARRAAAYRAYYEHMPPPGGRKEPMDCPALGHDAGSMLGARQEAWLDRGLGQGRARWNLLAQGVVMSHIDERAGPGRRYWTDSWNGYPASRQRLLDALVRHRTPNPVCLSGDLHTFLVGGIHATPDDLTTAVVATEFVTSSISSQGLSEARIDALRKENPNLVFGTSACRGYLRCEITPQRLAADPVAMERTDVRDASRRTLAAFVVEDGAPGVASG